MIGRTYVNRVQHVNYQFNARVLIFALHARKTFYYLLKLLNNNFRYGQSCSYVLAAAVAVTSTLDSISLFSTRFINSIAVRRNSFRTTSASGFPFQFARQYGVQPCNEGHARNVYFDIQTKRSE